MLRKIIVIIAMLAVIALSAFLYIKSAPKVAISVNPAEEQVETTAEETLPEVIYTFNIENVNENCSQENPQLCAVENAVKCTVNPDLEFCKNSRMPEFIFMKDPSIDRPSEISYKIIDKKVLPNGTTEIYTLSECNGEWFNLCQGTIIYVLSPVDETWQVEDIRGKEE